MYAELASDALDQRIPGKAGDRVRAIAAIHAIAEFFAEHPEIPVPNAITLGAHHSGMSREQVRRWAAMNDAKLRECDRTESAYVDASLNNVVPGFRFGCSYALYRDR